MKARVRWVECVAEDGAPWFQARTSMAVIGDIFVSKKRPGMFKWNARTMHDTRTGEYNSVTPEGYVYSFEDAKNIVEAILVATKTVEAVPEPAPVF